MGKTSIDWTDHSWNPMHGCSSAGPECDRCYAKSMAKRLTGMKSKGYENGFAVTLRHDRLSEPSRLKKPKMIFLCSMGDLFHEKVPYTFQALVFDAMMEADHHVYQVLTKRPSRMNEFVREWVAERFSDPDDWYKVRNIWLGTSVGTQNGVMRAHELVEVPARNRFLSLEPLIESVDIGPVLKATTPRTMALQRDHMDKAWPGGRIIEWVILGGETGPGARPMNSLWARKVWYDCRQVAVDFFFKHWGLNPIIAPDEAVAGVKEIPLDITKHLERKAE